MIRPVLVATAAGLVIGGLVLPAACGTPGLPGPVHFPLRDGHGGLACGDCHGDRLTPISAACASCHEDDRPPDHYPGDCGDCHTPTTWTDAVIDHERFLSLQGGHAPLACTDCHAEGTYEGLDAACASCHEPDRPADHFPGDCAGCHDVFDWEDGTFDHREFFPIPHHGIRSCDSCHPPPEGTASFTCIDCHTHAKDRTDGIHRGRRGYTYESAACLRCHPRGGD